MILCLHHQLLKLSEIKTDSDTSDSFLGQKWPFFYPKNGVFADFWMIKGISIPLLISKKNLSSSALQVDLICQVPYIADIKNCKNALNYPKISQKRSSWFQNGPFFAQK